MVCLVMVACLTLVLLLLLNYCGLRFLMVFVSNVCVLI